ncbi:MAG TPA: hypothetical protein VMW95_08255, partial [Desulfobacterales bacterium]|nr:hypothetical protein [Desulfobacterales bacterium]
MKVLETSEKRPLLLAQLNQHLIFNRGPIYRLFCGMRHRFFQILTRLMRINPQNTLFVSAIQLILTLKQKKWGPNNSGPMGFNKSTNFKLLEQSGNLAGFHIHI